MFDRIFHRGPSSHNKILAEMGINRKQRNIRAGAIDMHMHTSTGKRDDGRWPAENIVTAARFLGLGCIGLTPHVFMDNLEGLKAAQKIGQRVMPGVEIHVETQGFLFHILGMFPHFLYDSDLEASVNDSLAQLERQRDSYLQLLVKITESAFHVPLDFASVKSLGRNFGAGVSKCISEALQLDFFDVDFEGLHPQAPYGLTPQAAVALIRGHGGKAILAHPRWMYYHNRSQQRIIRARLSAFIENARLNAPQRLSVSQLFKWLRTSHPNKFKQFNFEVTKQWLAELYRTIEQEIIPAGIDAIETHNAMTALPTYPSPKKEYVQKDKELVAKYGLKESAGTDYHGREDEEELFGSVKLGTGIDDTFKHPLSMIDWLF